MTELDKGVVQKVMLAAQDLLKPFPEAPHKRDILPVIRSMGYLQIDSIQAVHRSQYLVLWSRLGNYDPGWLDEIHAAGELFEYTSHALCYLPIEDYPIFRGLMLYDDSVGNHWRDWATKHPQIVDHVRDVIKSQGPVCSTDFDAPAVSTGWGSVKKEKLALIRMWSAGELMVPYRRNFRRYFDLRERVLPDWDDRDALDKESAAKLLVEKAVIALGVANEDWIADYYYLKKTGLSEILSDLAINKVVMPVKVKGWDQPFYYHKCHQNLIDQAVDRDLPTSGTTLLSPFDPLISDRNRAEVLFDFKYRFEAYTPAKDRQFGYYCLPILHQGKLVGRIDPKAHRKENLMEIKHIFLEPDIKIGKSLVSGLKAALSRFTDWHGLSEWTVTASSPSELLEVIS